MVGAGRAMPETRDVPPVQCHTGGGQEGIEMFEVLTSEDRAAAVQIAPQPSRARARDGPDRRGGQAVTTSGGMATSAALR
jgi:hypothetical protein